MSFEKLCIASPLDGFLFQLDVHDIVVGEGLLIRHYNRSIGKVDEMRGVTKKECEWWRNLRAF